MSVGMALHAVLGIATLVQPPAPPTWTTGLHGVVYFPSGSAERLPFPGRDLIAEMAPTIPSDAYVVVAGKTDTLGGAEENLALSLRRARSVADELVARGVDPGQITLWACGERDLNRPTADDTSEALNRSAWFDWRSTPWRSSLNCEISAYAPSD